jgi:hypothetical protein
MDIYLSFFVSWCVLSTEYREWQRPLSGVHSIMMVKSAQPGEVGGCTPSPFPSTYTTSKVVVCALAERADTLPLFLLYPYMYCTLWCCPYPIPSSCRLWCCAPLSCRLFPMLMPTYCLKGRPLKTTLWVMLKTCRQPCSAVYTTVQSNQFCVILCL